MRKLKVTGYLIALPSSHARSRKGKLNQHESFVIHDFNAPIHSNINPQSPTS